MKKKILVVDDSGPSRVIPGLILRPFGFLVIETKSGEEAFEVLKSVRFDLILLDIQLPDSLGTEILDQIRKMPENSAVKVVAHTAIDNQKDALFYTAYGFDAFLSKPYRSTELLNCVRELLGFPLFK